MKKCLTFIIFFLCVIISNSQKVKGIEELVFLEGNSQFERVAIQFEKPVYEIHSSIWRLHPFRFRSKCKTITFSDSSRVDSCFNGHGELKSVNYSDGQRYVGIFFEKNKPTHVYQTVYVYCFSILVPIETPAENWLYFNDGKLIRKQIYSDAGELLKEERFDEDGIESTRLYYYKLEDISEDRREYESVTEYYRSGKIRRSYLNENGKLVDRMTFYDTLGIEMSYLTIWQNQLLTYNEKGKEPITASQVLEEYTFLYYDRKGDLENRCTLKGRTILFQPSETEGYFPIKKK